MATKKKKATKKSKATIDGSYTKLERFIANYVLIAIEDALADGQDEMQDVINNLPEDQVKRYNMAGLVADSVVARTRSSFRDIVYRYVTDARKVALEPESDDDDPEFALEEYQQLIWDGKLGDEMNDEDAERIMIKDIADKYAIDTSAPQWEAFESSLMMAAVEYYYAEHAMHAPGGRSSHMSEYNKEMRNAKKFFAKVLKSSK